MNSKAIVLGIDLGTTGVRIVAVSDNAAVVGESRENLAVDAHADKPGTQDPAAWWRATEAALFAIRQQVDLRHARALCIDATSGTVLAVDRRGRALSRGRMYNDKALTDTVDELAHLLPEESAARGASSPLARMIELQGPGMFKMLHQADWLSGQFSGRFDLSDEGNALKSGFDPIARTWPAWIAKTRLDPLLLPQVIPTGTDIGRIRPDVAAHFGLSKHLRIVSGTTDGCAAFIASGAQDFGDAVTSLGTTLTLKQVSDKPIAVARFGLYSHRLADRWLCGGASNSGGAVLLQFFSKRQIDALETKMNPERATNLNYYPLPSIGERFPHADASFEPLVHPRPLDDALFLQGLLEGIASIEKAGYLRLQEFGAPPLKKIFSVGGGADNRAWRIIRERVLGVPIMRGIADAAYGTALIALGAIEQKSPLTLNVCRSVTAADP